MVDVSQKRAKLIRISYVPSGQGSQPHEVFIPWTDDYNKALESAKTKLERFFPLDTKDEFRWLALKAGNGASWTELDAEVFPGIARELEDKAELRLNESYELENVVVLPLGRDEDTYYQFKIIVIGPSGVGKTMLLHCFTKPESDRVESLEATTKNSVDILNRFTTNDGVLLKAELWDTAGQERYRSLTRSTYRDVDGVLLVYDITKTETFMECEDWRKDLEKNIDNFNQLQIILVGNQIDLEGKREVSADEARAYAVRHRLKFAEVSAKEGTNVERTFQILMGAILIKLSACSELVQRKKSKNQQRQRETFAPKPSRSSGCSC